MTNDITQFHKCDDSLYWHGCYGSDTAFKKYITPDSFAHPAKMSFLLCDRIFKHLKTLGLLNTGDTICDFMAGSGRTNVVASLHGFDSVAIELEQHFTKMINDNVALTKKQINRNVNVEVIQGDARKLSELLKGKGFVGVVSPPYQDAVSIVSDLEQRKKRIQKYYDTIQGKNLPDKYKHSKESRLKELQGTTTKVIMGDFRYSSNPSNIGNLKDKQLVGITSPPFENQLMNNPNLSYEDAQKMVRAMYEKHGRKFSQKDLEHQIGLLQERAKRDYGNNPENLGNQQGESYLSAMLQVYQEAAKVLPVLVTVTKNPTRRGQLRRLDLDTAKLLMMAGYRIVDYHRAILWDDKKQATLKGNTIKQMKGRLSFFKRLSVSKGNVAAKFEDVIIAVIP